MREDPELDNIKLSIKDYIEIEPILKFEKFSVNFVDGQNLNANTFDSSP